MDHPHVLPFNLTQRDFQTDFFRAQYHAGATGDQQYNRGDIGQIVADGVVRAVTAAAGIGELLIVQQPWNLGPLGGDPRHGWLAERGVPCEIINPKDEWVLTLDGAFDATALDAVEMGAERDIEWDATEKCLKIIATATNPAVKMMRVWHGNFDINLADTHVPVVVKFLPSVLRG